jgi:hypothetical protein
MNLKLVQHLCVILGLCVLLGVCTLSLSLCSRSKSELETDPAAVAAAGTNPAAVAAAMTQQSYRLGEWIIVFYFASNAQEEAARYNLSEQPYQFHYTFENITAGTANYESRDQAEQFAHTFGNANTVPAPDASAGKAEAALTAIQQLLEEGADPAAVMILPDLVPAGEGGNQVKRAYRLAPPGRGYGIAWYLISFCNVQHLDKCAELLNRQIKGAYQLACAARVGDVSQIKSLLDQVKADPDKVGILRGALLVAVQYGQPDAVKVLLDAGADPTALGSEGTTPLMEACLNEDRKSLKLLLENMSPSGKEAYLSGVRAGSFSGQDVLAKMAMEDGDPRIREEAATRITAPAALTKVAVGAKEGRIQVFAAAVLRLGAGSEQIKEAKKAIFDPIPASRAVAIAALQDGALLAIVAKEDAEPSLRTAAVLKISDQAVLTGIACNDADLGMRSHAVEQLKDQAGLGQVALESTDWTIRSAAIRKLSDQPVLARVAAEDKDPSVRRLAQGRLNATKMADQAALLAAAIAAKDLDTSQAAVDLLSEQSSLARVAGESANWIVRSAALDRLTDQTLLARLAMESPDYLIRRAAAAKLTDQAVLAKIGREEQEVWVRRSAVERVTDPAAIESIYMVEEAEPLLRLVRSQMKDQRVFELQKLIGERAAGKDGKS